MPFSNSTLKIADEGLKLHLYTELIIFQVLFHFMITWKHFVLGAESHKLYKSA